MSDYTPTIEYTPTTEEVRRGWCDFAEWGTMTYEEAEDAFDHWLAQVKAEAWDEAYRRGIEDERTAEELQVGIGLGGYATANRSNPYRDQEPTP